MTGVLAWREKKGVCAMRVDNLADFELGCWFSILCKPELGKKASELEVTSPEPVAFVFELRPLTLLENDVLLAIPDAIGRRDGAWLLTWMFATVRRRLNELEASLPSASENEDFLLSGDGRLGRSIAVSISAVLSASSSVAISVAQLVVSNDKKGLLTRTSIDFASVITVALRLPGPTMRLLRGAFGHHPNAQLTGARNNKQPSTTIVMSVTQAFLWALRPHRANTGN